MPEWMDTALISPLGDMQEWLPMVTDALIAIVGAAAVIWLTALAWRKFKETTSKV